MSRIVISLTTIPSRVSEIGPVLNSLLEQSAQIEQVILWIPETYRRFGPCELDTRHIPKDINVRRCDHDYGPATKVLPAVRAFAGQDVRILYCDDDRIYHPDWAARMIQESDKNPGECIAEAGEKVEATVLKAFSGTWKYQLLTKATLGVYGHFLRKEIRALDPANGHVDIAKGYGGVLLRPEFLSDLAFEIPDHLWMVDDFWLSGCLAASGIKVRKIAALPNSTKTKLANVDALVDFVHEDHGRDAANLACIKHFQDHFGIWQQANIK